MQEYYLSSCLKLVDLQTFKPLSRYLNKEYKDINNIYEKKNIEKINYQIVLNNFENLLPISKSIYSLGKGIFYDAENDLVFISRKRDTGFFNIKNINFSIKGFKSGSKTINVFINKNTIINQPISSYLKFIFNFIKKGDFRNPFEIFSEIFVSQIVEPLIYYFLNKDGSILLHAAGLFKKESLLVFGPQNIGKTSTALTLAKNFNWQFYGDDFVILNQDKEINAFPKPLKIEPEQIKKFFSIKLKKNLFSFINRSNSEFKLSCKDFDLRIKKTGKVSTLIFLNRILQSKENISYRELTENECLHFLRNHLRAEFDTNKHIFRDIRDLLAINDPYFSLESFMNQNADDLLIWLSNNTRSFIFTFAKDVKPNDIARKIETIVNQMKI